MSLPHSELTQQIIQAAKAIHKELGPGQTPARYARELDHLLRQAGLDTRIDYRVYTGPEGQRKYLDTLHLIVNRTVGILIVKNQGQPGDRICNHLRTLIDAEGLDVGLVLSFTPSSIWPRRA